MVYHGRVLNSRIVLDDGVTLPEGAEVSVDVQPRKRSVQYEPVSSPVVPIQNCDRLFKFRCPKTWSALEATDEIGVRFCPSCKRQVYLCESPEEVEHHQGDCIAVRIEPPKRITLDELDEDECHYLGET